MDQANLELKVWKDLAISKQILMRTASDALDLPADCNADELKAALDIAIKRGKNADTAISKAQAEASDQVAAIEKKLKSTQKALAEVESKVDAAEAGRQEAEHRTLTAREANLKELKKATDQLAEKQKVIKSINTALADTPENVVKKLKKLKKEKFDEAAARKRAEDEVRNLKKQKKKLEETLEENKTSIENSEKLAEKYRELYALCTRQREQLEPLVEDKDSLAELPTMDEHLLESVEKVDKAA